MKHQDYQYFFWIDLEMTGLDPVENCILEIASVITDFDLKLIAEGPVLALNQPKEILSAMDRWNTKHHTQSGLVERVLASNITVTEAEEQTLSFVQQFGKPQTLPLCGNSIHHDRRFLNQYMPTLNNWLHYRNIDVSTVKELCKAWHPEIPTYSKKNLHTAREDIIESIAELQYYRSHLFK